MARIPCYTNNFYNIMPTLGLGLARSIERVSILIKVSLVCIDVIGEKCTTLCLMRLLWIGWKLLTCRIKIWDWEISLNPLSGGTPHGAKEKWLALPWAWYKVKACLVDHVHLNHSLGSCNANVVEIYIFFYMTTGTIYVARWLVTDYSLESFDNWHNQELALILDEWFMG